MHIKRCVFIVCVDVYLQLTLCVCKAVCESHNAARVTEKHCDVAAAATYDPVTL